MDPVEVLFSALAEIVPPYPKGVVEVPGRLPGFAFFPAGCGLFPLGGGEWGEELRAPLAPMPVGGALVLAHDFDTHAGFDRRLAERNEALRYGGSPRANRRKGLLTLLRDGGVAPEQCFFTNAYMGLRKEGSNMRESPQERCPNFVKRCQRFLLHELSVLRPSVVLTLGAWVPKFVAPLSPELRSWENVMELSELDRKGVAVVHGVTFRGIDVPTCSVVALTHHTVPRPWVKRCYGVWENDEAEVEMIREAVAVSGLAESARKLPPKTKPDTYVTMWFESDDVEKLGLGFATTSG